LRLAIDADAIRSLPNRCGSGGRLPCCSNCSTAQPPVQSLPHKATACSQLWPLQQCRGLRAMPAAQLSPQPLSPPPAAPVNHTCPLSAITTLVTNCSLVHCTRNSHWQHAAPQSSQHPCDECQLSVGRSNTATAQRCDLSSEQHLDKGRAKWGHGADSAWTHRQCCRCRSRHNSSRRDGLDKMQV
jgi:hypothetical protein